MQTEIKQIQYGTEEYKTALEIRNEVLRKPQNLNIFEEDLSKDKQASHFVALVDGKIVGTVILDNHDGITMKLCQFGILKEFRSEGLGRQMLSFVEQYARSLHYKRMYLHGRVAAAGFYENRGYSAFGSEFLEVGVAHREMAKVL